MIELRNVSKRFGKAEIIKQINADFETGKITGIVGNNGSGKTVLFKMICGLMLPTQGEITVNGERIGKDVDFPSSIGIIIETPGFINWQSGYQNLEELAVLKNKIGKTKIRETLLQVGLDPDDKKHVGKYSLGMRQRLGIAQAIMENPDVLILDEPMNGLDKHGVEEIRQLLLQLKEDKTILLASHNPADIELLCDDIYEMDNGILMHRG